MQIIEQFLEALAVFGCINHVGRSADNGHARFFQPQGQFQRRLTAILHDHAGGLFFIDDFQYVFECEWLEVQPVRGVVIGRDGFGVAVDHDGLIAIFTHGQRRVHAAVVELDALTYAVGATAQHHDFFLVGGFSLALFFVSGIQIGHTGRKLGRPGLHAFIYRTYA